MPDPLKHTVSASEVPALFDASPWVTRWMLYQRFAHGVELPKQEDFRMRMGKLLQPVIMQLTAEELRLDVTPREDTREHYVRHEKHPVGCSLDAWTRCPTRGLGMVECKNVDWLRWKETYTFDQEGACIAAPAHYEIQLQTQMLVTGAKWGVISTLVGGNELELLERRPDEAVHAAIISAVYAFLDDVKHAREPDVLKACEYDLVSYLVEGFEPEPPLDLRNAHEDGEEVFEAALEYNEVKAKRRDLDKREKALKARLVDFARRHGSPSVILTDEGTLRLSKGKDTFRKLPTEIRALADAARGYVSEEILDAVLEAETQIARRGSVSVTFKEVSE